MSVKYENIILQRDVNAYLIPSGARIFLQKDTEVVITQQLGTSFTVNIYGNLARIEGTDADALGKTVQQVQENYDNLSLEDAVYAQLRTCYDPEIPVNIVDLGLIYECKTEMQNDDPEKNIVNIKMTLTAPGCGMGPIIADDVKRKVESLSKVVEAKIDLVFDPPWNREMMSDEAKLALGIL